MYTTNTQRAVDPLTCPPETRLSVVAAAARAGVSAKTLRRYIAAGKVAAERLGPRTLRVRAGEIDAAFKPVFEEYLPTWGSDHGRPDHHPRAQQQAAPAAPPRPLGPLVPPRHP